MKMNYMHAFLGDHTRRGTCALHLSVVVSGPQRRASLDAHSAATDGQMSLVQCDDVTYRREKALVNIAQVRLLFAAAAATSDGQITNQIK